MADIPHQGSLVLMPKNLQASRFALLLFAASISTILPPGDVTMYFTSLPPFRPAYRAITAAFLHVFQMPLKISIPLRPDPHHIEPDPRGPDHLQQPSTINGMFMVVDPLVQIFCVANIMPGMLIWSVEMD
jgi:hypothetical protein